MRKLSLTRWTPLAASIISLGCFLPASGQTAAPAKSTQAEPVEYLSDHVELVLSTSQGWGELGWNVAAHASGQAGSPLQVGDRTYAKGLGHHANGSINVLLEGEYAAFDAEVGLQPCSGGSVIFRIFVDGQQHFDSGVLRMTNAPTPVHVDLAGAQELRLEANDAGDGITCDMANWLNARLTRASAVARSASEQPVDVARFARVVTWDPNRTDGARASRIEEFRAEDLFLESDLPVSPDGTYQVPVSANGLGCIGLQWLNRRALKELALEFPAGAQAPTTNAVQVQGWLGESAWQGGWKPLAGDLRATGSRLVFRLSPKAGVVQTQKIRWVFPASGKVVVRRLYAFSHSRWQTVKLLVEAEKPARSARGELVICNGEFLTGGNSRLKEVPTGTPQLGPAVPDSLSLDLRRPLHLTLLSSRTSMFKSDPTVLQFRLPSGSFGVAVEDVLNNECVYLPDYGIIVTRDPAPITLADYKRKIASRKTILQQVRELPDQTLAQAMARTHHDAQREGPVMLSLACDNTKFVVERDGTLRFQATTNLTGDWFATAGAIHPSFGDGQPAMLSRSLDGGWLPIPVITAENKGVLYCQRTFVAPSDEAGSNPARLNRPSLCVSEFTVTNTLAQPAEASLALNFLAGSRQQKGASLTRCPGGYCAADEAGTFALAATNTTTPLNVSVNGSDLKLNGTLPPHASTTFVLWLPAPSNAVSALPAPARLRAETEAYWNAVLAPAMQVETPDPLLNNVIRSSQVRCLIAARNEAGGTRIAPWISAMSYGPLESEAHSVIRGMDFMGHEEFARRGLDFFIHRYNTNGFLTTGYTTFGTAWHLWTLGEHYQLYRDQDWLRQVAPEVERVAEWIVRQTEKTKRVAAPESGLMPPGVLADWNSFAYHYAMNAYYYGALHEVGTALSDLSNPRSSRRKSAPTEEPAFHASRLALTHATELRANILRAYRWTQAQSPALPLRNGTWIPHYPSQVHSPGKLADFFPGQDGGRSWCYDVEIGAHQLVPTGVLDPDDRDVGRMLDHMEDVQFLADGWFDYPAAMNEKDWFNLGGFSKVQPYYTRNCEVYALRDDVKPFVRSYFNTIAAMLNPEVLTFWEHFHHSGAWDKTHETGYFLHQTRTMLVTERGDQLWLAPFITCNWLKDGQTLSVSNAPTRFGPVSYHLESHIAQGFIRASIQPPTRETPSRIVLRLRHPEGGHIRSVEVNGKPQRDFDKAKGLVRLKPLGQTLELKVFYQHPRA
ncbi:MAG: NPCBM/NEW2 domain-containing protein [Limisphaerales bacterium]